ncbi:YfbU family protein [Duganella callida]|uniref:YfbU family protein n=1 Tax=Duganella callida TaxID=2561932 RepID=A0A4Y9SAH1_9BURK|nr:YfbU family protein [Duganella callida]TFW17553.1 hypothetical protein E4L98_20325 [Duganella callida]
MAPKTERFEMRIEDTQLEQIDRWAEQQADQPTRAEAIRRLVNIGLSNVNDKSVHFSDGEKMLMLMMGDVYKALKIKDGEMEPDFLAQVIYGGHYWAPKWEMNGVFHGHVDDPEEVKYVVDVLDMWTFMEVAYAKLSVEDKARITREVGSWQTDVRFSGFDGNEEGSQMGIAQFLVDKMRRFSQFKGRSLNSHCSTVGRYRRMYQLFEPMRRTLVGMDLSADQLITLLKV